MVFPKKNLHWNMIFVVLSGKMIFFFKKYDIFSLDGKWEMIFRKKYMEIWYFLYICINVSNMILPSCKKDRRWYSPEKIHLKVIDILDSILQRVPTTLIDIDIFIYCFSAKKKATENLIHKIEIWRLLQSFWLEIFYNEESSILCTIQTSGVVFRGALGR